MLLDPPTKSTTTNASASKNVNRASQRAFGSAAIPISLSAIA